MILGDMIAGWAPQDSYLSSDIYISGLTKWCLWWIYNDIYRGTVKFVIAPIPTNTFWFVANTNIYGKSFL